MPLANIQGFPPLYSGLLASFHVLKCEQVDQIKSDNCTRQSRAPFSNSRTAPRDGPEPPGQASHSIQRRIDRSRVTIDRSNIDAKSSEPDRECSSFTSRVLPATTETCTSIVTLRVVDLRRRLLLLPASLCWHRPSVPVLYDGYWHCAQQHLHPTIFQFSAL